MYHIYHIPGKKIGVTRNLFNRVTKQQGYKPEEYEVLLTTEDISKASKMEIELQKSYGYKVDRQTYKNLIKSNPMKINVTEQTTTFPCPKEDLRGYLIANKGKVIETNHGSMELTDVTIDIIVTNAMVSMYNDQRCFVYNKAMAEKQSTKKEQPNKKEPLLKETEVNVYDLIRDWAKERGIYERGDSQTQYVKLMEEAGELAQALLKRDEPEIYDAIGDMVVVLTNLAELEGVKIEDCINDAYNEIANRKGKMINGTFVKETL